MERPLVSAVIATYNSEGTLEIILKALRRQTYPKECLEILIVDGMSKDRTREIAKEYDCVILDNPKVEQGNAKILGMKAEKGSYVLFVDSDEELENPEAIARTVAALEQNKDCHVALCSGYKKPDSYSNLSGYISDFGDPFSFYIYGCPKDYRFFLKFMRAHYEVLNETEDHCVFDCDLGKKFLLQEGGCGGIMMDMDYFNEILPECKESIAALYHSFYEMYAHGETKLVFMKDDPLAHYSSARVAGYMRKLKWRVCNNVHFKEKAKEVFSGREKYDKRNPLKKPLFVLYGISLVIPFIHSIPYAVSRRNPAYLWHCIFSFYVVIQILWQYLLRTLHITPAYVAYGSKNKI